MSKRFHWDVDDYSPGLGYFDTRIVQAGLKKLMGKTTEKSEASPSVITYYEY